MKKRFFIRLNLKKELKKALKESNTSHKFLKDACVWSFDKILGQYIRKFKPTLHNKVCHILEEPTLKR